jgi:hypothetical protein
MLDPPCESRLALAPPVVIGNADFPGLLGEIV